MSQGRITRYVERHHFITTHIEAETPQAVYPGWTNFTSQRAVRAIAVAPRSRVLWLVTWGGVISWKQQGGQPFRRYSSEHGLAGNSAACICIDSKERPWVGHIEGGLSYFNGQHWQVYEDLQSDRLRILCRAADSSGIWAATRDAVYLIPKEDEPPLSIPSMDRKAVSEAQALLDLGDKLLLGNSWGLFALKRDSEPVQVLKGTLQTCTALTLDRNGCVWIGTPEGVYRLDNGIPSGPILPEETEAGAYVLQLTASWDRIWALTTTGLAQIVDDRWLPLTAPFERPSALYSIASYPEGTQLWVGTDRLLASVQAHGRAEPVWNEEWLPLQTADKLNNLGHCIAQQKFDGRIWIGTAGGLVAFSADDSWTLYDESSNIRTLGLSGLDAQKMLWILAWPHGIHSWASSGLLVPCNHQPTGQTTDFHVGRDGNLYILAGHSLWRLSGGELQVITRFVPDGARSLVETPDERWWLGTTRGVYQLTSGGWELVGDQPGPLQSGVRALVVAHGYLWASTETGLWKRHHEQWTRYDVAPNEDLSDVRTLAPAGGDGALWLAREDRITRYDPATRKQSEQFTCRNSGLGSCRVTALAEIEDTLWIVTQSGISRFKLT